MTDHPSNRGRWSGLSTRAIHLGYDPASEQGALTPPVFMTSTYAFETAEDGAALFRGEKDGYIYGRTKNPTQSVLEARIADLEGAEAGLVSCELDGGLEAGIRFMNRLVLATRAVSLGDAETLVQHPASMTHATYGAEERARHGIADGLIRLSIGLENLPDIREDILQALDAVTQTRGAVKSPLQEVRP
nr:PLP-dependent transferase [Azospirillum sp. B510]